MVDDDDGEAGLVDELLVLEGVHDEGEELRDGSAGELKDDVVAVAPVGSKLCIGVSIFVRFRRRG
jgi:hypothetical protein